MKASHMNDHKIKPTQKSRRPSKQPTRKKESQLPTICITALISSALTFGAMYAFEKYQASTKIDIPSFSDSTPLQVTIKNNAISTQTKVTEPNPPAAPLSKYMPEDYTLSWEDDFSTLDSKNWSFGLTSDISDAKLIWDPNSGGEFCLNDQYGSYIMEDDVNIEDGNLVLTNQKRDVMGTSPARAFSYTSGWVNSMNKRFFNGTKKGVYLEVRAKFPSGLKVWPAIWLVTEEKHWPPEIDVWEYFGHYWNGSDLMYMRYIYPKTEKQRWLKKNRGESSVPIKDFDKIYDCEAWHIYGYQWTEDRMVWSVDGKMMRTLLRKDLENGQFWPDEDFCLVLNNAVATKAKDLNTSWPNHLIIDYLSVYEKH